VVPAKTFDRHTLKQALRDLGQRAYAIGKTIELSIYGGSALTLTYDWRLATKDVDAVFEADRATVRALVAEIAVQNGWDANWLNDGVKGFLSSADSDSKQLFGTYPSEAEAGLRVMLPRPEYLFAMKCRAMRIGGVDGSADVDDIRRLATEIGVQSAEQALGIVSSFYPGRIIEAKTQFGIEEIFSGMNADDSR
jgi:hypothetical protein